MGITDKIADSLAKGFGWLLIRELRRIAVAIEKGVDSQRELAGFNPIFKPVPTPTDVQISQELLDTSGPEFKDDGDYVRLEILEALARENRIVVTMETDLVALGKARGWLDETGQVVMLPQGYGE